MSVSRRWLWAWWLFGILGACESHDRVLTPDPGDGRGGSSGASGDASGGTGGANTGGSGATGGASGGTGGATGGSAGASGGTGGTGGATGGSAGATGGASGSGSTVDGGDPIDVIVADTSNDGQGGAGGASDAASDTAIDTSRPPTAQDPDCDLNGIWITQQITVATAIGATQYANVWQYIELQQNGTDVLVTKQFECGGEVKGTLHVTLREVTTRSLMTHNRQTGRRGTMKKGTTGLCEVTFERYWDVRGAVEANYIPAAGRNSNADLSQVQMERPLPKASAPAGAEDWDSDGHQGLGWDVAGVVTGRRHSVQRDWSSWFTDSAYTLMPALNWPTEIMIRAEADLEDVVFDTEPAGNLLLASVAVTDIRNANNRLIMRFLGRNASDPRVAAIPITGTDPAADGASALATCLAIQKAMPAKMSRANP
ncbi:MAG: hypothetical protein ABW133_17970 [Polyangiaceae bacterium]